MSIPLKRRIYDIDELTTALYRTRLLDETDAPLVILELRLTLYQAEGVKVPTEILNGRDDQDVLNANGVTYDASTGEFLWRLSPSDAVIQDPRRAFEKHVALFRLRYIGGADRHEVRLRVRNLRKAA